jgi:hypothetical protein
LQIEQRGIPLRATSGLSVNATYYLEDRSWAGNVELKDEGPKLPDMKENDGVFSATVVPRTDGRYRFFVTARYIEPPPEPTTTTPESISSRMLGDGMAPRKDEAREERFTLQSSVGKMFPVNQDGYMGCGSGYFGMKKC